ncbi:MAG: 2'-5' RNA ligase family protein [Cellulosilyticaceae bacterium]
MQYVIVSEVTGEAGDFNNSLRREVKEKLGARSSKLPAHFTIKAPFEYEGDLGELKGVLEQFAKGEKAYPYRLEGYDHFDDRVVYMKVLMSAEAKDVHDRLLDAMACVPYIQYTRNDGKDKTFHVTVSSKRIQPIFHKIWDYVKDYPCDFDCWFDNIAIYRWENQTWVLEGRYELGQNEQK